VLLVVKKIAFYLIRLLPKEDLKKGVIYQAQRGVTGVSKRSASPTAILMMGIAGSGKSTVLRHLVKNQQDWVRADPDAVKEALPEYKEGVARGDTTIATKVHDESKDINKAIAARAIKHHRNLIYDATGNDKGDYQMLIDSLKQTDYRIRLVLVHTPVNIALARVKQRALETGRDVPENVVKFQATRVPKNFEELSTQVDEAFIYSGAGAMGNRPVVEWKLGHGAKPTEKIKDLDKRGG